jgi:hypothetical protein
MISAGACYNVPLNGETGLLSDSVQSDIFRGVFSFPAANLHKNAIANYSSAVLKSISIIPF